jgi:hypothetical protein
MPGTFTKTFFSGDIARGAEQGVVELIGTYNFGTYATGGIVVDFSNIENCPANSSILSFQSGISSDGTTYARFDAANNKILGLVQSTDAEVANATDLSAAGKHVPLRIVFRISSAVSQNTTL